MFQSVGFHLLARMFAHGGRKKNGKRALCCGPSVGSHFASSSANFSNIGVLLYIHGVWYVLSVLVDFALPHFGCFLCARFSGLARFVVWFPFGVPRRTARVRTLIFTKQVACGAPVAKWWNNVMPKRISRVYGYHISMFCILRWAYRSASENMCSTCHLKNYPPIVSPLSNHTSPVGAWNWLARGIKSKFQSRSIQTSGLRGSGCPKPTNAPWRPAPTPAGPI